MKLHTYLILFAHFVISYSEVVNFWMISDNDGITNCSYLTYNSLNFKTNEIKVLSNDTLYPNELSSLTYNDGKLYTIDDGTGFIYEITNKNALIYDINNIFIKGEAMCKLGNYLYIYNYTKYEKKLDNQVYHNLIKYNFKTKNITNTYNLTNLINKYLSKNNYKNIVINAMFLLKKNLYLVPRYYHEYDNKKIINRNHFLVVNDKINIILLSKKLPKEYAITDMEIDNDKIYFVASKEIKVKDSKTFGSIVFVTNLNGKLLTKFIKYDKYNKYEGITINKQNNDFFEMISYHI